MLYYIFSLSVVGAWKAIREEFEDLTIRDRPFNLKGVGG